MKTRRNMRCDTCGIPTNKGLHGKDEPRCRCGGLFREMPRRFFGQRTFPRKTQEAA